MPDTLSEAIPAECMEVLVRLWDYLDNTLDPSAADALRAHLEACPPCLEYQQFQEAYLEAMRRLQVQSRGAPWGVRARIVSALAEASTAS